MAAKLLIRLEEPGREPFGAGQRELILRSISRLYATAILHAMDLGPDSDDGFDVVSHPGQLLTLQKLGSSLGKAAPPAYFDNRAKVIRFIAAALKG